MTASRLPELLAIMERLRAADGCPWDRQQTFSSIAPYTIEEAYEVADAIEQGDLPHLKEELGDLLVSGGVSRANGARSGRIRLRVGGGGDLRQTGTAPSACLRRRRCAQRRRTERRVGGPEGARAARGEQAMRRRRQATGNPAAGAAARAASALDGVPQALPALMRAHKLSKRAARVGFDWEHASQTADKVAEELAEVREAAAAGAGAPSASREIVRFGSEESAICCSPRPIWRASSMSTRRRRCAPRMQNSSAASGPWKPWPRSAAKSFEI